MVGVQNILLYTHSIATCDPVINVIRGDTVAEVRNHLVAYATVMSYTLPLIHNGCIFFCENDEWLYRGCRNDPPCHSIEWDGTVRDLLRFESDAKKVKWRIDGLIEDLWRVDRLSNVDFHLKSPDDPHFLVWMFDERHRDVIPWREIQDPSRIPDDELSIVHTLIDLPLPGVGTLDAKDVVEIRQGYEFEYWRDTLRQELSVLRKPRHSSTRNSAC